MQTIYSTMETKIFISCADADRDLCWRLLEHLSWLQRSNNITVCHDQEIPPGANKEQQIKDRLREAHLILLLISSSFLSSKYEIVEAALERRKPGAVEVIPIILKSVDWQKSLLGKLEALPVGNDPISLWRDQDAALKDVIQGIRSVVETLQRTRQHKFDGKGVPSEGDRLRAPQKERRKVVNSNGRADHEYVFGVDIDRSRLTILLTKRHDVTNSVELWSGPFDIGWGAEMGFTRVAKELHAMVRRNGVTWEQVVGIGLAMPGPLDRDSVRIHSPSQTMRSASQMPPDWEDIQHIPNYLRFHLKLEKKIDILLGRDANMGALAESYYGAGQEAKNFAYVKIARGIGTGLVIEQHLYRGSTNAAGEIGHVVAVTGEEAVECTCGQSGCLETVASEEAIVKAAQKGNQLHIRDSNSHQTPRLEERKDIMGIRDVIRAAQDGDEASKAALENAAKWIARPGLGALINIVNPELILLDGDVVQYDSFVKIILKGINTCCLHANCAGIQVKSCDLPFPVVFGAAAHINDYLSGKHQRKPQSHRTK